MFENFFHLSLPGSYFIFRAVIVYLAVILLLRVSGKRQLSQIGTTEFVAILLISNAVQNAMNGGDNTVGAGLILGTTLIALSWLISFATYKSRKMSALFEGTPRLIIHKGHVIEKNLAKELLTHSELGALLRKQGIHSITEVKIGILEASGTLSVTRE